MQWNLADLLILIVCPLCCRQLLRRAITFQLDCCSWSWFLCLWWESYLSLWWLLLSKPLKCTSLKPFLSWGHVQSNYDHEWVMSYRKLKGHLRMVEVGPIFVSTGVPMAVWGQIVIKWFCWTWSSCMPLTFCIIWFECWLLPKLLATQCMHNTLLFGIV